MLKHETEDQENVEEGALVLEAKAEIILFFVQLAERTGLPRSLGQIYGLLFCSPIPMAFKDVVDQSGISKGSVSQGLRTLETMKAVRPVVQLDDRRTFYEAETSARKILGNLLEETVDPSLKNNTQQLTEMAGRMSEIDTEEAQLIHSRLHSLRVWHQKVNRVLPWVLKLTTRDKGD